MLFALLTGTLALAPAVQVDTTLNAVRGQRLDVNAYAGEVTVRAWNRNAVRIEADGRSGSARDFQQRDRYQYSDPGGTTRPARGDHASNQRTRLDRSQPGRGEYQRQGRRDPGSDHRSRRSRAKWTSPVGRALISLRSVQGSVRLRGARGRINVNSVNDDVQVANSSGDIAAQTVNGEILLQGVDASSVDANTVNGDISYSGPIRSGGRYALSTHNGDLTLTVPEGTSAGVTVSTFSGEFESEFPVPLQGTRKGKGFNFTLGSGSAQVTLESFQGTIQLVRPGSEEDPARQKRDHDRDHDED